MLEIFVWRFINCRSLQYIFLINIGPLFSDFSKISYFGFLYNDENSFLLKIFSIEIAEKSMGQKISIRRSSLFYKKWFFDFISFSRGIFQNKNYNIFCQPRYQSKCYNLKIKNPCKINRKSGDKNMNWYILQISTSISSL